MFEPKNTIQVQKRHVSCLIILSSADDVLSQLNWVENASALLLYFFKRSRSANGYAQDFFNFDPE
jgi:hypothetical protein